MQPSHSPRPHAPAGAQTAPTRGGPLRVLVVESERAVAREIAGAFQARGLLARVVSIGQSALDLVPVERPDLIVLGAELPDLSGYAVCSQLKRDRATDSIPIIMTTTHGEHGGVEAHRRLWVRADAYLRKPFDAAALLQLAAMLVDLPAAPAEPVQAPPPVVEEAAEEVLEDGFVYLGGAGEPEVLEDQLVNVVAPAATLTAAGDEVLEEGFEYVGGGSAPEATEDVAVRVLDCQRLLENAARTAPGRWKLPPGMGVSAA